MKSLRAATKGVADSGAWKKFVRPSVRRGKTTWPLSPADQERYGVRFDFDGEVMQNGQKFYKFQLQPNAGKVPASIQDWKNKNRGTHAVMTVVMIKEDATKEEVVESIQDAIKNVKF